MGTTAPPLRFRAVGVVGHCVQERHSDAPRASDHGLSEEDAEAHVHGICFKTGPPGQVGVELEWLVSDQRDPALRAAEELERVTQAVRRPHDGETPGSPPGRRELSTKTGG